MSNKEPQNIQQGTAEYRRAGEGTLRDWAFLVRCSAVHGDSGTAGGCGPLRPHPATSNLGINISGRRPPVTVAWGNAPGNRGPTRFLAEGHIHNPPCPWGEQGLRPKAALSQFTIRAGYVHRCEDTAVVRDGGTDVTSNEGNGRRLSDDHQGNRYRLQFTMVQLFEATAVVPPSCRLLLLTASGVRAHRVTLR